MVERGVVGHEIEHEAQAALLQSLANARERAIAAQRRRRRIADNRETRAGDVFLTQIRQRLLEFLAQFGNGTRYPLARCTCAPDAQEPDPIETCRCETIEVGVRNVVERRVPPQRSGQRREPDARVDLIERGITRRAHISVFGRAPRMSSCHAAVAAPPCYAAKAPLSSFVPALAPLQ